jgi:hypothetical protein
MSIFYKNCVNIMNANETEGIELIIKVKSIVSNLIIYSIIVQTLRD